jgi:hypothetical protein
LPKLRQIIYPTSLKSGYLLQIFVPLIIPVTLFKKYVGAFFCKRTKYRRFTTISCFGGALFRYIQLAAWLGQCRIIDTHFNYSSGNLSCFQAFFNFLLNMLFYIFKIFCWNSINLHKTDLNSRSFLRFYPYFLICWRLSTTLYVAWSHWK